MTEVQSGIALIVTLAVVVMLFCKPGSDHRGEEEST